ncbi:MAG: hypothetical protein ACRYFS_24875 [Janthinobacterium lividum]
MEDPSTTFLFWNIQKRFLTQNLARLVEGHDVQVLLLAESPYRNDPKLLLDALNAVPQLRGRPPFLEVPGTSVTKVQIFSRLKRARWKSMMSHSHYAIWTLFTDANNRLLLTAAHFPSIQEDQGDGQRKVAIDLRNDLSDLEASRPLLRTDANGQKQAPYSFVIGDLNANPFDAGIAGIYGLNANLSRDVVRRGKGVRDLHKRSYQLLYNPMWRFFGAPTSGTIRARRVQGTYYDRLTKPVCYDWFVLDQVLIRPNMLPYFEENNLEVLMQDTEQGGVPLVSPEGIPKVSDHLPLLFRIRL